MHIRCRFLTKWLMLLVGCSGPGPSALAATPQAYAAVAPLLAQRCVVCHTGPQAAAGLRLDSHEAILRGSAKGPVVKPGDAANSELVRRVKGSSLPRMPMTGPPFLDEREVAALESWVNAGAPAGPAGVPAQASAPPAVPSKPSANAPVTWAQVAPVLAMRCAKCHTDNGLMGPAPEGLRLTSHAAALDASDRARIVPGRPEASELVRRIRGQAWPRMPMDGPPYLTDDEVKLVETWVRQGARDANGQAAQLPAGARLRLHGTLGNGWLLDDLPLLVTGATRIDKQPGPGSRVQVRGRTTADGQVLVERLRSR